MARRAGRPGSGVPCCGRGRFAAAAPVTGWAHGDRRGEPRPSGQVGRLGPHRGLERRRRTTGPTSPTTWATTPLTSTPTAACSRARSGSTWRTWCPWRPCTATTSHPSTSPPAPGAGGRRARDHRPRSRPPRPRRRLRPRAPRRRRGRRRRRRPAGWRGVLLNIMGHDARRDGRPRCAARSHPRHRRTGDLRLLLRPARAFRRGGGRGAGRCRRGLDGRPGLDLRAGVVRPAPRRRRDHGAARRLHRRVAELYSFRRDRVTGRRGSMVTLLAEEGRS